MKHVVNYSGGVCSFWAAHRVIQRHGVQDVTLLFADTLIEDQDLYRFNGDAERFLGVKITRIADGRTPWQVMRKERMIGNSRIDPCSKILKRNLLWKWIDANAVEFEAVIYLGLDWTEGHRLDRLRLRKPQWKIEAPMMNEPVWDKTRMFAELVKVGIAIPRLYTMGFPHNNCGGFCIKAGQAHFAHLLRVLPERFAFHEAQEKELNATLGKGTILKESIGGQSVPLSLQTLRERIEAGKQFDRLDWGGCGCAVEPPEPSHQPKSP